MVNSNFYGLVCDTKMRLRIHFCSILLGCCLCAADNHSNSTCREYGVRRIQLPHRHRSRNNETGKWSAPDRVLIGWQEADVSLQLLIQRMIPLCSSQYERQFNTVRIPGKEAGQFFSSDTRTLAHPFSLDKLVHYSDSHHIVVYHQGRWFKIFMFYKNHLLQPCEVQM